jgi:NADH-quinone oxidoreductase subunit D
VTLTDPATAERTVTVGTGAGADDLPTADMVLNIGPQHPSTHGVLRLRLVLDGERVVSAEPIIGYMHRGAEKLFEVRDYRQITVLANRHDWLSAFSNELGVVLAVERMLGMEVPERAVWLRTLLAELNRVLSHLMFLGSFPLEMGAITPMFYAFRERETLQAVLEEASGGRMHYMFNRVGGLKEDVPAAWTERVRRAVAEVRSRVARDLERLIRRNEIFLARTTGVGVLTEANARAYGVSGPAARASGVDFDLRRDDPYLAYGELAGALRVPVRTTGDCYSRFECLLEQVYASLDLCDAVLDRLPGIGGPVNVRLPKTVKAPEGHTYCWTENPLGLNGYYLVSRGEKTPWRLKLRSASYNNVQALKVLLPGTLLPDLVAVLGSLFFVVGDIDK